MPTTPDTGGGLPGGIHHHDANTSPTCPAPARENRLTEGIVRWSRRPTEIPSLFPARTAGRATSGRLMRWLP